MDVLEGSAFFDALSNSAGWFLSNWFLLSLLLVVYLARTASSGSSRSALSRERRRQMMILKDELERVNPHSLEAETLRNTLLNANIGCVGGKGSSASPKRKTLRRSVSFNEKVKIRYFDKFKRVEFATEESKIIGF